MREHELAVSVSDAIQVGYHFTSLLGEHLHLLIHLNQKNVVGEAS